ncbi:MAG TPA: hypothetical protein VIX37_15055 [Candidatus Sulfotelmatobacter sp.]
MSPAKAGLVIICGCALVSIAIANKHFYWSRGWLIGDKEALRWSGGLLFGFVGVLIIVDGVRDL